MRILSTLALLFATLMAMPACASDIVWFDGQHPITYSLSGHADPVVATALRMWRDDMRQVTGMEPQPSSKATIRIVQRKGRHDAFRIYTESGHIVVEGGNARGTAYGILELSRMAGVSPWVWWGDVVPERKERLVVADGFATSQAPSVEYRGIFLNDEDWSLRPWSCTHFSKAPYGEITAQTYKKVFELLLRLRANTIWPAMHEGTKAFFQTDGAKAMADSCGIVVGTSHCEPLMRNNVGEWDVAQRGRFNYKTNRQAVHDYWIERLRQVKGTDNNFFTIGMRGIHDSSMEGYQTDDEKFDALQQVIDDQQELLRKYVGNPARLMQMFVPYKEVLQLYEKGLRVPDYATLLWCDDNYGYMTRLSDASEQQRQGGAGVYYHLSYWGRPHDYLWLTTTQPGLIYNEMRQAYDHQVRKLWIANVHDPKVACYDLELFLDLAWDIEHFSGDMLRGHLLSWLCRQFGEEAGRRLMPVMHEFYALCGARRPEFMGWSQTELDKRVYDRGLSGVRNTAFSTEAFGGELDRYLERCQWVARQVDDAEPLVRPALRDAFFAAVKYPVQAAAAHAVKMLEAQRARMLANGSTGAKETERVGLMQQAVAKSMAAYQRVRQLTWYYNNQMSGGKWHGSMSDHPRDLPVFWAPLTPVTLTSAEQDSLLAIPIANGSHPLLADGVVARNAFDYDRASEGVQAVQMLGHSMNAVALPKGAELSYRFDVADEGEYLLTIAMIPTQPNDSGDLRYTVTLDDGAPTVYSLKESFRSEPWKQNVLRQQALRQSKVSLSKGTHTLVIRALDEHIVVDQWMLDPKPGRQFYLIPVKPAEATLPGELSK